MSRLAERERGRGALAAVACFMAAALTLLLPSVPSYDPWSWLVWGREILDLDLRTTNGPSWKPLPVLFTAPFSLLGSAAPELWLVVARAATFGAVLAAVALGTRLGGRLAGVLAGAVLMASPWLWGSVWTGTSEGILILCLLGAAERHLARRRGQAFALAVAGGLLRPEAWPFLGLYAVWLVVEDRRRLAWIAGGLALLPLLWLLPELWGSGSLFRGAERAQQPGGHAPALAARPALAVIERAVLIPPPHVPLGVAIWGLAALVPRWRDFDVRRSTVLGALAAAWVLVVAVATEFGFSGIDRYLYAPVAVGCVLAGLGFARATRAVLAPGRLRPVRVGAALLAGAAAAVAVAPKFDRDYPVVNQLDHEAEVIGELDLAIERAGGERALDACGRVYASFQTTPSIAWQLGRHLEEVSPFPRPPGTVFRATLILDQPLDPPPTALAGAPGRREVARTEHWHVEAACR